MTTYNTGNPIGSKDPRDLYDNAENLDEAVNTRTAESWDDRFGVARKTWWGMEQDFQQFLINSGYENIGDYTAGLEITARNQIFWRDGELYRAGAVLELPYTTTGDWGDEGGLFVAVGDTALRQELADNVTPGNGAELIGFRRDNEPGSTVHDSLSLALDSVEALETSVDDLEIKLDVEIPAIKSAILGASLSPIVVDMHFTTLRATGWLPNELGGVWSAQSTAGVEAGDTIIPVDTTTGFFEGQLVTYIDADGDYRTLKIRGLVPGTSISASYPLPVALPSGTYFYTAYNNNAHPNEHGYKAIADDALRQITRRESIAYSNGSHTQWTTVGASTVEPRAVGGGVMSYTFPGGSASGTVAASVTPVNANDGAASEWVTLAAGTYRGSLYLNPLNNSDLVVRIRIKMASEQDYVLQEAPVSSGNEVTRADLNFSVPRGGSARMEVISQGPNLFGFYLGSITYTKIDAMAPDLNRGVHVLLGDSWINAQVIGNRLAEKLPNATIINKGIGGDNATQLRNRFYVDVKPNNPDFVWVMCGTNDAHQLRSVDAFQADLNILKARIAEIGAQAIFFTPSVVDISVSNGTKFARSRGYAILTEVLDEHFRP